MNKEKKENKQRELLLSLGTMIMEEVDNIDKQLLLMNKIEELGNLIYNSCMEDNLL